MTEKEIPKTISLQDLGKIAQHLQQLNDNKLVHVQTAAMPDFYHIVSTLNQLAAGKIVINA